MPSGAPRSPSSAAVGAATLSGQQQALYFPALDGLRFIAFLLVFVHHLPPYGSTFLRIVGEHGWVGVHLFLFLFLSAFLLTSILRSEMAVTGTVSVRNFYVRRALRIWPLYFAFCLAIIAYRVLLQPGVPMDWPRAAGLLLFVDNIVAGWHGYNQLPFSAHLWTISLEEQFYLALPFVAAGLLATPRRFQAWLVGCWVAFVAIRALGVQLGARHPLIWTSLFSADALLFGTLLACGSVRYPAAAAGRVLFVLGSLACLFSVALMPPITANGVHQVFMYTLIGLGAAGITVAALRDPLLAFLKTAGFRYLGKISYGLYVFHLLGIQAGKTFARGFDVSPAAAWWIAAAAAAACTIALAAMSYALLEKSFLGLKKRFEAVRTRPV